MKRTVWLMMFVYVLLGSSVYAFLPDDASAREPQIRAYRQRVRDAYERRVIEKKEAAARAYEQTRREIFIPPWERKSAVNGVVTASESAPVVVQSREEERNNRLLVSIVLLILIGTAAGWVRYVTRTSDE